MASDKKWTIWTIFQGKDQLSGTIAKINQNVRKMSATASGMSRTMMGGFDSLRTAANFFIAGQITRKLVEFGEKGDMLSKTARQLGLTAESLEQLQFAAERQGITSEDFVKSFQNMNKFVGQARAGTGAISTLLQKTNPQMLEQLKHVKNSEEAFNLLANAISKMPNKMDAAALSAAAFGRTGPQFLIMSENGVAGINALREEATKYGLISNEAAQKSEEFQDAITNLTAAGKGFMYAVLSPTIKLLTPVISLFTNLLSQHRELIFVMGGAVVAYVGLAQGLKVYATMLKIVPVLTKAWTFAQKLLNLAFVSSPIGWIVLGITALIVIVVLIIKHWKEFGAWFRKVGDWIAMIWSRVVEGFKSAFQWIKNVFAIGIRVALLIAFAPLFAIYAAVKAVIDLVKGKSLKEALGNFNPMGFIKNGFGGGEETRTSPNASSTTTTNKSVVDVNLNNVPRGSTVRQQGNAPGVTLALGHN